MKKNGLKIRTQLQLGFAIIFIFVVCLGIVAYFQTENISRQTQILFEHPLQVRRAIGYLKADILSIQRDMKELMLTDSNQIIADTIADLETYEIDAYNQIEVLHSQYLGPQSDVNQVELEFARWNSIREETIRLLKEGNIAEATRRTSSTGVGSNQAATVLNALGKIDNFAINKGNDLFTTSQQLRHTLHNQLIFLVCAILLLSLLINYLLLRNIRQPLDDLSRATQAFKNGDYQTRSTYKQHNEFGELSDSFNQLAETIQNELELKNKTSNLAYILLSLDETGQFFQAMLTNMAEQTGSQMAAVYLRNPDQKTFEHFVSIGLNDKGRISFAADELEGEFGAALASRKIQHIANLPTDSRFIYSSVTGGILPREIITLPVISDNQVIAIISLATIKNYNNTDLQFVNEIWGTLNARIEGVLAFRQIQSLTEQLKNQNRELETQKSELNAQTVELSQQNRELEAQKKQLDDANRLKTSFISNMSHELRTPLNSVIALAGVLNRRLANQIPEEEYGFLEVIERNGKQLLALINDILDLSRIEAGREEIDASLFDINDLVAEVVSTLAPLAQQKNIGLLHHPATRLAPLVSDYVKCRQILQNLVGNAIKFTETGQVEITAQQSDGMVEISVCDTGIGITEDQIQHIFDEFRQADGGTSRRYGGTGLGLTIAQKFAQLLGGDISVTSMIGKGSEFTLSLPLRINTKTVHSTETGDQTILKTMPANPHMSASFDLSQKVILLVEDNEPAIVQLKDVLEEHACQILVSHNGAEALEAIQSTIPDAIILDLMMPDVDGFELLKTIRDDEKTAGVPVLILTAKHITKEELDFLKTNNIHQLIQKGDVNRRQLLNAVAGMMAPHDKTIEKPPASPQIMEGKPVILVVEDNPDNMLTARALLADRFTVIEAEDGKNGLEQARKYMPHLILMDIALPIMDGVKTFKIIRNDPLLHNIPVIALTASVMTNDREAILSYGFDGYISKPIDQAIFMQTILQVLNG